MATTKPRYTPAERARTWRPGPDPLTPLDLIDWEAAHPGHTSSKEAAIRTELALAPARYYQLVLRAAGTAEAVAHDPMTCARLNTPPRPRLSDLSAHHLETT